MIVVFIVVLIVFGPRKLPELARGLGKLMAEFRKASTDFRTAFEEEMRDLERQAREVERRKIAESSRAAAAQEEAQPATLAAPSGVETDTPPACPEMSSCDTDETGVTGEPETPVIAPVSESVPRAAEPAAGSERAAASPSEEELDAERNTQANA
jgi:sec-independent protein translocase protein TatB